MNKYLLISLITLVLAAPTGAKELFPESVDDLQNIQTNFFSYPMTTPDVEKTTELKPEGEPNQITPVFKKIRLKLTRDYKKFENKTDEKIQEFQDKHFKPKSEADTLLFNKKENEDESNEINIKLNKPQESDAVENNPTPLINIQVDENIQEASESLELEGGVREQIVEKDMVLDCAMVEYYQDREEIEATGNPIMTFPQQKTSIKADKMVYNVPANILKCFGNVEILKEGNPVYGDYIQVNLNEENAFMDNVRTEAAYLTVRAKKAVSMDNVTVLEKGTAAAENSYFLRLETRMYGPRLSDMLISDDDRSYFKEEIGQPEFNIKTSEVHVNAKKEHDTFTLKDPVVYYKDKRLFGLPSFTAHTDKDRSYFEANYPEFGSITRVGMYAGPGFVFDVPYVGSTIKVIPFLNYRNKFGIGGALKYRAANNFTQFSYGSAEDVFVLRGRQELDDDLYLQYGMNSYLDDWFLGMRMPHYGAEAIYDKKYSNVNFMGERKRTQFRHRIGAGYFADNDINWNGEDIAATNEKTARVKYMAEVDQSFYRYEDKEKLRVFDVGMTLQGSAAIYGTGDTQFIGRIGPRIKTQYKYWMQDIGYFLSGYSDQSPMPRFDAYRYGHSNIYIREALRLNKWLTLAWSGSINASGDSYNGKPFQENAFIVALGPDDFKVSLGYDFVREMTYFMVSMAMDVKGSSIEFDKMVIKNGDRLGQSSKPKDEFDFEEPSDKAIQKTNRVYAEIINIEDPDKEKI